MWLKFETGGKLDLKDPAMIVAVSTSIQQYRAMYSQGRELAKYMRKMLEFEKVATMYSSSFAPEVIVRDDGISNLPACHFYLHRGKRDLLLFAGDTSPMDEQYEFTKLVLGYAKEAGVTEVYSVGARWSENPTPEFQEAEVNGFATDLEGVERLVKNGVRPIKGEPAPFFASMVVAMAAEYGIRGFKLSVDHGEPAPHTRSVVKMLEVLTKMVGFEIELSDLNAQVKAPPTPRQPDEGTIYR